MRRYAQLIEAVARRQPRQVLELGTLDGERAVAMRRAVRGEFFYTGFDVFEAGDAELDAREWNGKTGRRKTREYVAARLKGAGVEHLLVQGDTRLTLPPFCDGRAPFVDLAWIDGGHSVETIRGDTEQVLRLLTPRGLILWDDYYSGEGAPTGEFGCNAVVARFPGHVVLPVTDRTREGLGVQIAMLELAEGR